MSDCLAPAPSRDRAQFTLVLALLAATSAVVAQEPPADPRIGKQVVQKANDFVLRLDTGIVEGSRSQITLYRVERVDGPRLWLHAERFEGWAEATEVVPVEQAIEHFTDLIRAHPRDAFGYMMRAMIWRDVRKELDLALGDYNEAVSLNPTEPYLYLHRGSTWSQKKEYDRAIADFDEAIRLEPKNASAFGSRGLARREIGEYDKAIADFDEAVRLDPRDAISMMNNRGSIWRRKKEYDKAIVEFTEAIRLDPKLAYTFISRGNVWRDKKEYDRAIADYDEAIRLDPKLAFSWCNRAVVLLMAGRDGAERDARKAIELDGWRGDAMPYAVLYGHFGARRMKQEEAAIRLLDDAAQRGDTSKWPYPVVRFLRREIDESALLAIAVDDDKRTMARCFLGLDHEFAGRPDEAREHFRWVKDHGNPNQISYTIAVTELDRLNTSAKP